jgi:hypothetical protein
LHWTRSKAVKTQVDRGGPGYRRHAGAHQADRGPRGGGVIERPTRVPPAYAGRGAAGALR